MSKDFKIGDLPILTQLVDESTLEIPDYIEDNIPLLTKTEDGSILNILNTTRSNTTKISSPYKQIQYDPFLKINILNGSIHDTLAEIHHLLFLISQIEQISIDDEKIKKIKTSLIAKKNTIIKYPDTYKYKEETYQQLKEFYEYLQNILYETTNLQIDISNQDGFLYLNSLINAKIEQLFKILHSIKSIPPQIYLSFRDQLKGIISDFGIGLSANILEFSDYTESVEKMKKINNEIHLYLSIKTDTFF